MIRRPSHAPAGSRSRLLSVAGVGPTLVVLVAVLAACGTSGSEPPRSTTATTLGASPTSSAATTPKGDADVVPLEDVQMAKPAAFSGAVLAPDILVYSKDTLPKKVVEEIRAVDGIAAVDQFSMAQFFNQETPVSYAAVNPATFRKFTDSATAQSATLWDRVAAGEMAVLPKLGKEIQNSKAYVRMGNDNGAPLAHIGAYANLVKKADGSDLVQAVVNEKWASRLGMKPDNALLIATGTTSPQSIKKRLDAAVGKVATVQILAVDLKTSGYQTAVLTGGSVASRIGTMRYTPLGGGRVQVDPAWVREYIRTESVPILGNVTCNRIMIPQLRAALTEIVQRGLASKIHPGEYGGCYVPRFIANTTSLSFHSYGTAVDLNVPGNGRGTRGEIDRTVVAIFKKWGFEWGGDWRWTDPMHFELHRLVRAG